MPIRVRHRLTGLHLVALALTLPAPALAAPCPTIAGGSEALTEHDSEARLAFIRARMKHDAWRARQWSLGYGTGYALLTGASAIAAPLIKDRASVPDLYVGGFSSIIGFGLIAVSPLKVIFDREELEAQIEKAGPGGDRCALLATAEAMLIADAKNERFGRSWLIHSGNVLVGVGALLVLGLGYDRWGSGIANGIASIAVGEVMIFTQPVGLVRDLKRYRLGDLSQPTRRRKRIAWGGAPMVTPPGTGAGVYGLSLMGRF
ncbi:MAG TPA: hypothetical protein VGB85_18375 [Nannocystis sp.]